MCLLGHVAVMLMILFNQGATIDGAGLSAPCGFIFKTGGALMMSNLTAINFGSWDSSLQERGYVISIGVSNSQSQIIRSVSVSSIIDFSEPGLSLTLIITLTNTLSLDKAVTSSTT